MVSSLSGECLGPSEGKFLLEDFPDEEEFLVHGDPVQPSEGQAVQQQPLATAISSIRLSAVLPNSSQLTSTISIVVPPPRRASSAKKSRVVANVHVVLASMKREGKDASLTRKNKHTYLLQRQMPT